MSSGLCKDVINEMFTNHIYLIYMSKLDLTLNNLLWLICHKTVGQTECFSFGEATSLGEGKL